MRHARFFSGVLALFLFCASARIYAGDIASAPWRFWVLSDIHEYPSEKTYPHGIAPRFNKLVEALVQGVQQKTLERPEFILIAGDSTNGNLSDSLELQDRAPAWWEFFQEALAPFSQAGLPVYVVAGNHDSYLPAQREAYEQAWQNMVPGGWFASEAQRKPSGTPLTTVPPVTDVHLGRAPFSYSFEKNGVLFIGAHIVDENLDPEVERFLKEELSKQNPMKIVFAHVPVVSVLSPHRSPGFNEKMLDLLGRHKVAAYICGHEHFFWDESFPGKKKGDVPLHQIIVGTASATYNQPLNDAVKRSCRRHTDADYDCVMPQTKRHFKAGMRFEDKTAPYVFEEDQRQVFTEFIIDNTDTDHQTVTAVPHTLRDGALADFYE